MDSAVVVLGEESGPDTWLLLAETSSQSCVLTPSALLAHLLLLVPKVLWSLPTCLSFISFSLFLPRVWYPEKS